MNAFIKRTGGAKTITEIMMHLRYIGFRTREGNSRGFFSAQKDNADFKQFVQRIKNNNALKHPSTNKIHKMVFSLGKRETECYERSGKDLKDLVRQIIKTYEEKHNIKIDWIASQHNTEDNRHNHVHVVIKAVTNSKDKNGHCSRIRFNKDDFAEMRGIFINEFYKDVESLEINYQYENFIDRINHEYNQYEEGISEFGEFFEKLLKDISYENQRAANEAKRVKERDQKEHERERGVK